MEALLDFLLTFHQDEDDYGDLGSTRLINPILATQLACADSGENCHLFRE
jgi:hypothetical protein